MPPDRNRHYPAIDYIKALAIVAVAVTHAGPFLYGPSVSAGELFVRDGMASFHVPAFLILSGFLSYRAAVDLSFMARRALRVLAPYLVASLLVLAGGWSTDLDGNGIAFLLLTGGARGIYFFVFVLAISMSVTLVAARGRAWLPDLLLPVVATYWTAACLLPEIRVVQSLSFYDAVRDPTGPLVHFLAGWVAARHWQRLHAVLQPRIAALKVVSAVTIAIYYWHWPAILASPARAVLQLPYTLAVMALVTIATTRTRVPAAVRFLSAASYPIYLYHDLVITRVFGYTTQLGVVPRVCVLTAVGIGGTAVFVMVARRLLGSRSRLVIGA